MKKQGSGRLVPYVLAALSRIVSSILSRIVEKEKEQ